MGLKTCAASRWRRIVVEITLCLLLSLTAYSLIQSASEAARRATTKSRLTQIGVALSNYHDDYLAFPPAVVLGPDGVPWHSWRVLLLPYINHQELADKYRMDEPWDSPANLQLVEQCPEVFQLPTSEVRPGFANASVIVGRRTAWPAHYPLSAREFERGVSNTISVVDAAANTEWTNPRDLTVREFLRLFYSKTEKTKTFVTLGDGTVRYLPQEIDRQLLLRLLAPRGPKLTFRGENWPTMFAEPKSRSDGKVISSDILDNSTFHSSWNEPLDEHLNGLWCAVFQLAWDRLKSRIGGPVTAAEQSPVFDSLNDSPFNKDCLQESSYSLSEQRADRQSTENLREDIRNSFPDANPTLTDINDPAAIRLYGILKKSIFFPAEFSAMDPLNFKANDSNALVESFGNESSDSRQERLAFEDTVYVGDYISDEDFIITLQTEGGREDEIILAMIQPEATLKECWQTVQQRLKSPHEHRVAETLRPGELLQVPILDLNIEHRFTELENQIVTNFTDGSPAAITVARETIRFRLDEVGADLLSQVEIVVVLGEFGGDGGAAFDPEKPRQFVFDRPFLLALREKSAGQPYLLSWVAHPDIMVPSEPVSESDQ